MNEFYFPTIQTRREVGTISEQMNGAKPVRERDGGIRQRAASSRGPTARGDPAWLRSVTEGREQGEAARRVRPDHADTAGRAK